MCVAAQVMESCRIGSWGSSSDVYMKKIWKKLKASTKRVSSRLSFYDHLRNAVPIFRNMVKEAALPACFKKCLIRGDVPVAVFGVMILNDRFHYKSSRPAESHVANK